MSTASNPNSAPGPIEPSETFELASRDGTRLYAEWFPISSPRAVVLIAHGYLEHCGRYREVAHVLNRAGLAALSFDMRGHGQSDGQRGYVDGIEDLLNDVDAALHKLLQFARDLSPERELPMVLLGHSNGGLTVLRALCDTGRRNERVVAAVVSSPFLGFRVQIPVPRKLMARAASRWFPRLSLPGELRLDWLTTDAQKQEERRMDTLCHEVATARWYTSALEAQEYVADFAGRIAVPTLWLVSAEDQLADPRVTHMVHARLRAPSSYHELAGMQHEVFNERERGRVFALLSEFLDEQLRQPA